MWGQHQDRGGPVRPHGGHRHQAQDAVEGDGVGPACLGVLDRPGAGAVRQLLRQLVDLPLGLGIHRKLILHGDFRQFFSEISYFFSKIDFVLCDRAGEVQ